MNVRSPMIVISLAFVMLCGCSEAKKNFEESFKKSYEKSFTKSCTESAIKSGTPEAQAKNACSCVAKKLVETYSAAELTKMSDIKDPETQKIMKQAVDACK